MYLSRFLEFSLELVFLRTGICEWVLATNAYQQTFKMFNSGVVRVVKPEKFSFQKKVCLFVYRSGRMNIIVLELVLRIKTDRRSGRTLLERLSI